MDFIAEDRFGNKYPVSECSYCGAGPDVIFQDKPHGDVVCKSCGKSILIWENESDVCPTLTIYMQADSGGFSSEKEEKNPEDYYFALLPENSEYCEVDYDDDDKHCERPIVIPTFVITRRKVWDEEHRWDDRACGLMFLCDKGFSELAEALYSYLGSKHEAREILLSLGLVECPELVQD